VEPGRGIIYIPRDQDQQLTRRYLVLTLKNKANSAFFSIGSTLSPFLFNFSPSGISQCPTIIISVTMAFGESFLAGVRLVAEEVLVAVPGRLLLVGVGILLRKGAPFGFLGVIRIVSSLL